MIITRVAIALVSVMIAGGLWFAILYVLSVTDIIFIKALASYLSNDAIFGYIFFGLAAIQIIEVIVWRLLKNSQRAWGAISEAHCAGCFRIRRYLALDEIHTLAGR